jgi:hypothetical protein
VHKIVNEDPQIIDYNQGYFIRYLIKKLLNKNPDLRPSIIELFQMKDVQDNIQLLKKQYKIYEKFDIADKIKNLNFK